MLCEFTNPGSSCYIGDLLVSAGYPHICVTADKRRMAYECCLVHEVVTKRIPALDDIRKGLQSVNVAGETSLRLLERWPELRMRFFPPLESEVFDIATLRTHFVYEADIDDPATQRAQEYFEKYLDELDTRGCTAHIFYT